MQPPYKSSTGTWYTQPLFWDCWINTQISLRKPFPPIFSLHNDQKGMINCRKTFVELGDPSGYKWAMKYLGDYEHWKALMKSQWFQKAVEVWVNEIKVKVRSEALDTIRAIAAGDNPANALAAAKYLYEWDKPGRGRPSAAEVKGELKRAAEALKQEDDDAIRIGLVKNG